MSEQEMFMWISKIDGHRNSNILHCLEWRELLKKAILYRGKVILLGKAIIHKNTSINTSPKKKRFSKQVYCPINTLLMLSTGERESDVRQL